MSGAWQPPFRTAVADLVTAAQPSALDPDDVHLLVPAESWDWEVMPTGETPAAQIGFCDTMPASCTPGSQYAASSDSFSDAYATFLDLLVDFTPANRLAAAQARVAPPPGDPASSVSPPGWTKTEDGAGMLRWALDWIVPTTPSEWMIEEAAGGSATRTFQPGAPASVQLLDAAGDVTDTVATAPAEPLSMSGSGWSRVPVYPGSWYSGSVVGLGQDGPFAGGRKPDAVVGPAGILRCRVAELIVAEQVSVTATLASAADAEDVAGAAAVQLGSVAADAGCTTVEADTVTVATPPAEPYLVGVIYAQP